jgi:hypothetical protein
VTVTPPNCAGGKYSDGTLVSLTAQPNSDFNFSNWSGAVTGTANPTTLRMNGDKTVTASFQKAGSTCYRLTRLRDGDGSVPVASPSSSSGCPTDEFTPGQAITLTANPTAGWRVVGWNGTSNDSSSSEVNSLTMPNGAHTVQVNYILVPQPSGAVLYLPVGLHLPRYCFPLGSESEPNNYPAQANGPLCSSGVYSGLPNDGLDYFEIRTSRTGPITVTVRNHRGEGVQLSLYYDDVSKPPVARDGDQRDGLLVEVADAAPGRYYIVIYAETPKPEVTTPYSMDVSFP